MVLAENPNRSGVTGDKAQNGLSYYSLVAVNEPHMRRRRSKLARPSLPVVMIADRQAQLELFPISNAGDLPRLFNRDGRVPPQLAPCRTPDLGAKETDQRVGEAERLK
jgi:hypothetical protein